jgi:small-conductance mechanosensitive channel
MSSPSGPSQPNSKTGPQPWRGLDVPAILAVPGMLFAPWLLLILLLIRDQQPGVICFTPFFWLLGPVIGLGLPQFSRSQTRRALRREAFLAGGLLGFLFGVTYLIGALTVFEPGPATRSFALLSGAGLLVFGMVSCALLAGWVAGQAIRRLGLDDE